MKQKKIFKTLLCTAVSAVLTAVLLTGCGGGGGGTGTGPNNPSNPSNPGSGPSSGKTDITEKDNTTGVEWAYAKSSGNTVTLVGYSRTGQAPSGKVDVPSATKDGYKVTAIGAKALYQSKVASVTIPSTVKTIGEGAFAECTALRSVSIPNSVESIGASAFYHSGLEQVVIPASVKQVGMAAFYNCTALQSVAVNGAAVFDGSAYKEIGRAHV